MKVSISLSDDDLAFLDAYAARAGVPSRSAVVQIAVRQLRATELVDAYGAAWDEWESSGDASLWDSTAGDK